MIALIAAVAKNNAIGKDNQLLWHITEDLKYFRAVTSGGTVIMGRKTFESVGKPLPKRRNIVISRNNDYEAEGIEMAKSLEEAFLLAANDEKVFVIGGGEIYRQAMPFADYLYITWVNVEYEADTFFPEVDLNTWSVVEATDYERGSAFGYPFSFVKYKKG